MPSALYVPVLIAGMILTVRPHTHSTVSSLTLLPQGSSNSLWSKYQACALASHSCPRRLTLLPGHAMCRELRRSNLQASRPLRAARLADPTNVPSVPFPVPSLSRLTSLPVPVGEMLCMSHPGSLSSPPSPTHRAFRFPPRALRLDRISPLFLRPSTP